MELAVRDAEGAPIRCEFIDGQGSQLKITAGDVEYSIGVSIAGATGAWVYNTRPSVKKMYIVKSAERGRPVDIRLLRLSRQSDALSIGGRAFFELNDGKILQLLLVGTLYYRDGDDLDEARFKYKIYDAGSFLIDAL